MAPYLPYLFICIGILMVVVPFFKKYDAEELAKKGERCEGIIFKLDFKDNNNWNTDSIPIKDKITVRFVTKKQEWITEDVNTDFMILSTGQYREGQKVKVIYNPDNPTEFILENSQSPKTVKLTFILVGLFFLGFGIYKYLTTN